MDDVRVGIRNIGGKIPNTEYPVIEKINKFIPTLAPVKLRFKLFKS